MKAHLIQSADPLKEGTVLTVACGDEVRNSKFVFMLDFKFGLDVEWKSTNICKRCCALNYPKGILYGVVEGQESMEGA